MESTEVLDDGGLTPRLKVVYDPTSLHYDMNGDKLMFIFNNRYFKKSRHFRYPQRPRPESDEDAARLHKTFANNGFKVDKPYNDFTYDQILTKLQDVCEMDHRNTSCVAMVILTNGNADGEVNAADKPYLLGDVINQVLLAPNLAGKPKLFFIPVTSPDSKRKLREISLAGRMESANALEIHTFRETV